MKWRVTDGWCRPQGKAASLNGFFIASSTRTLGDMARPRVFDAALRRTGLTPRRWAAGEQVHGRSVRFVKRPTAPRRIPGVDGVATALPGLVLQVHTADCVPVFVLAPDARAAAMVHAGWRGVHKKILTAAIALLRKRFGAKPAKMTVLVGPHIQPCCCEVGPAVARKFKDRPRGVIRRGTRLFLDLTACLRAEAAAAGVPANRFSAAPHCSRHDDRFFSYRRNKTEKRMAAVLAIKTEP